MLTFLQHSSNTSIKTLYELILTFLFQIEHTADDGPRVLHLENNRETALSVRFTLYATGSVTESERSTFVMDNYINVNKNVNNLFILIVRFKRFK